MIKIEELKILNKHKHIAITELARIRLNKRNILVEDIVDGISRVKLLNNIPLIKR